MSVPNRQFRGRLVERDPRVAYRRIRSGRRCDEGQSTHQQENWLRPRAQRCGGAGWGSRDGSGREGIAVALIIAVGSPEAGCQVPGPVRLGLRRISAAARSGRAGCLPRPGRVAYYSVTIPDRHGRPVVCGLQRRRTGQVLWRCLTADSARGSLYFRIGYGEYSSFSRTTC